MVLKPVKAKKYLGQHFLTDSNIAKKIASSLTNHQKTDVLLEIGPGMGMLTQFLIESNQNQLYLVEIDQESVNYLSEKYATLKNRIIFDDFLKLNLSLLFPEKELSIIGNFPYNISSQILFKILDHQKQIPQMVGMFQKEVAERVVAQSGNKTYGILSVLIQAYYEVNYLFTVSPGVFSPPPKVQSAVIRLNKKKEQPNCDKETLFKVVKVGFNQRRKTLRNTLKNILNPIQLEKIGSLLSKRPEQLSVTEFIQIAQIAQVTSPS